MDYESVMSLLAFVSLCTFLSCFAVCLGYFFKLHYLVLLRLSLDPSLLQAKPASSASPHERCSRPLSIFVTPGWTHSIGPRLSFTRVPRTDTPEVASPMLHKGEGSFPLTCWQCSSQCSPGGC